ncbi:phosphotransferase [Actinoplanes sp. NPDC026623]|uniref:phosphotransferase n=1 Tax=Actinoplanes sp. NPDC026623 TaxID=3155610 RepID=UPI0033C843AA
MPDGAADREVPQLGGRMTPGVVRVGDTVRRPGSPASPFVAQLLTHLASRGFEGAPGYLGEDRAGREILTYVPGEVPAKWRAFADEQVARAAILLRRMHDASRDLAERLGGGDVVCHHDPGPNNTVFRDGLPVAFIDFDFAAVGDPLEDVGYLAWSWCVSSKPARGPATGQARQVRVLADAYGLSEDQRRRLPAAIENRFIRNDRFWGDRACRHREGPAGSGAAEMLAWTRQEAAHFASRRPTFAAALDAPCRAEVAQRRPDPVRASTANRP